MQIYIFSFLDVMDISNILVTSKNAYNSKNIIVRDIWSERYPSLYNKTEHTITNMFYTDMVFKYLESYNLNSIMGLLDLNRIHKKDSKCDTIHEYDTLRVKVDRFSVVISKLQRTYDHLHKILMTKLDDGEDEEDLEMFTSAMMEYGPSVYSEILKSDNPYMGVIDDDMLEERSNPIWFEEQEYDDIKVEDVNMEDMDEEFHMDESMEALEDEYDEIDDYECVCMNYGVDPDFIYDRQEEELNRIENIMDEHPIRSITNLLYLTDDHPELLSNIKNSIMDYMDQLMPKTIHSMLPDY
jgi:hypothetical protein